MTVEQQTNQFRLLFLLSYTPLATVQLYNLKSSYNHTSILFLVT